MKNELLKWCDFNTLFKTEIMQYYLCSIFFYCCLSCVIPLRYLPKRSTVTQEMKGWAHVYFDTIA